MAAGFDFVAELQSIRAGVSLLFDDPFDILPTREQERRYGRWDGEDDVCDLVIGDDSGAARHG